MDRVYVGNIREIVMMQGKVKPWERRWSTEPQGIRMTKGDTQIIKEKLERLERAWNRMQNEIDNLHNRLVDLEGRKVK